MLSCSQHHSTVGRQAAVERNTGSIAERGEFRNMGGAARLAPMPSHLLLLRAAKLAGGEAAGRRRIRPALMSRFVARLFSDLILRSDDFIEAVMVVRLRTVVVASHSFVARRQQLARVLLPRVERFLFFVEGKIRIANNIARLVEMFGRIFDFRIFLRLYIGHWGLLTVLDMVMAQLSIMSWRTVKFHS